MTRRVKIHSEIPFSDVPLQDVPLNGHPESQGMGSEKFSTKFRRSWTWAKAIPAKASPSNFFMFNPCKLRKVQINAGHAAKHRKNKQQIMKRRHNAKHADDQREKIEWNVGKGGFLKDGLGDMDGKFFPDSLGL